jgi:hypothetical protein
MLVRSSYIPIDTPIRFDFGNPFFDQHGFQNIFKIIPEREKIRLCPLILQGNYGGLHKIRFRNSA